MKSRRGKLTDPIAVPIGVGKNNQPITVVVIDDDFTDRRIMSTLLKSIGFTVVAEAEDGKEGIERIDDFFPQLVVCDYHMPRMNGKSTLLKIKSDFPGIVVAMSTSETSSDVVVEILSAGADEYIVKPIDRAKVIYKLMKLVKKHF